MVAERTKPIWVPEGGPGEIERPSPEIFQTMGEEGIFALLAKVYDELEASEVRVMFPEDMGAASERSAAFFVQLLGGPALFNERHGAPRMRMRHVPFEIDEHAREVWLGAFHTALDDFIERDAFPAEHVAGFRTFLDGFSAWMVNVAPTAT